MSKMPKLTIHKPTKQIEIMSPNHVLRNDSGVILLIVILLTIVLSIITISIMSLNVSHVKTGEQTVDSIVSEELAKGVFYQNQSSLFSGSGTPLGQSSQAQVNLNNKTYTIDGTKQVGSGPSGTDKIAITVNGP
jgi:hypothetical protein